MIIKVCGMREPGNIEAVAALSPDYMGFIFYPSSKRFVAELNSDDIGILDPSIRKTGVFVNEAVDVITEKVLNYNLNAVQLHGDETPEYCRTLKTLIRNVQAEKQVELIKAFGVSEDFDFEVLSDFEETADKYLFDTKTESYGGSGQTFNWAVLSRYQGKLPFLLSGGIGPDNLEGLQDLNHAKFSGVDLNSKFEVSPGLKDIAKLKSAFSLLRSED